MPAAPIFTPPSQEPVDTEYRAEEARNSRDNAGVDIERGRERYD